MAWIRSRQCYIKGLMERLLWSKARGVHCKQEWWVVVRVCVWGGTVQIKYDGMDKRKVILREVFDDMIVLTKRARVWCKQEWRVVVCVWVRCRQNMTVWIWSNQYYVKGLMERLLVSKARGVWGKQEWRVVVRVRMVAVQTRNDGVDQDSYIGLLRGRAKNWTTAPDVGSNLCYL